MRESMYNKNGCIIFEGVKYKIKTKNTPEDLAKEKLLKKIEDPLNVENVLLTDNSSHIVLSEN